MLSGATRGAGGAALARHLLSTKFGQHVRLVEPRFLASADLGGQLRELVADAAHGRTDRPVYHLHVDPPLGWDRPETISTFLRHLEREFGLEDQPRAGVLHSKNGREHAHIVYSLVRQDGRIVDLSHDYRRREKVAVLTAAELNLPPPPIPRPRTVARALMQEGRSHVIAWMRQHYALGASLRLSELSPERRHIQQRTDIPAVDMRAVLAAAWPPTSPLEFQLALRRAGLSLAVGDKALVIVDSTGTAHALNRELRAACRAAGVEPPKAAAVHKALQGLRLPPVRNIRRLQEIVENDRTRREAADCIAPTDDRNYEHPRGRAETAPHSGTAPGAGGGGGSDTRDHSAAGADSTSALEDRVRRVRALNTLIQAGRALVTIIAAQRLRSRIAVARIAKGVLQMHKPYDPNKQDYKTQLLTEIGPTVAGFGDRVHMVKASKKTGMPHRLLCHDGSWVEIDSDRQAVRTWGDGRTAQEIAAALAAEDGHTVEHLKKSAMAAAPGAARRAAPVLTDEQSRTLADRWRAKGFTDVTEDDRGVWIALDSGTRLFDTGDRVEIHGAFTDEALAALARKSADEWSGQLRLFGDWTDEAKGRMWLESMRHGVTLLEYEPNAELLACWETERDAAGRGTGQSLRPDNVSAAVGAEPVPPNGSSNKPEAQEPEPDLTAFDRQCISLDRRQADLEQRQHETHKERSDYFQRTERLDLRAAQAKAFQEQEELRQAEAKIQEAREILAHARELAVPKGLDYESAIAVAKAEFLAEKEQGHQPRSRLRR